MDFVFVFLMEKKSSIGTCGVMVNVVEIGHGEPSSNPK